ncbi:MAG: hypothetical protein K0U38_06880 [Epsilonproteobacteria bacterium]|nr:hypothetical protein [Campylobacterota bacterium]
MKKLLISILPLLLSAENYEDKFYKDKNHHPSNIGIHTDLGYSSYMVELHSSEIESAINYDILEFTLGASYSYDAWMWGAYGKLLLNEIKSNMYTTSTHKALGDHADIDKNEFALYGNYTLKEDEKSSWRINSIYRYASLNAKDSYLSYHSYESLFKYKTQGLALSVVYSQKLTQNALWSISTGLVYSQAQVKMSESVDSTPQDSYVDDQSQALGFKLGANYNHKILENLFFNLRTEWWQSNFGELEVDSRVGNKLPSASLKEQTLSVYSGVTWRF